MKASVKVLHWLPRIICIVAIFFFSRYALNAIESYLTIWQQILIFLVHLIPSALLIGLLIIAWKWELMGGILFTLIGLGLAPVIFQHYSNLHYSLVMNLGIVMMVGLPLMFIGILFILSSIKRRQYRMIHSNNIINR